jgi:hypothetical protein
VIDSFAGALLVEEMTVEEMPDEEP